MLKWMLGSARKRTTAEPNNSQRETAEEDSDSNVVIRTFTIDEANPFEKTIAGMLNNTVKLEGYKGDEENIFFLKDGGFVEEDIIKLKSRMNIEERNIAPHGREICIRMHEIR